MGRLSCWLFWVTYAVVLAFVLDLVACLTPAERSEVKSAGALICDTAVPTIDAILASEGADGDGGIASVDADGGSEIAFAIVVHAKHHRHHRHGDGGVDARATSDANAAPD